MKRSLLCILILSVTLLGCSPASPNGNTGEAAASAAPATLPPLPAETSEPAGAPAETAAPAAITVETAAPPITAAPAASTGLLPAPLLMIAPQEEIGQIWRIEVDGASSHAITNEAVDVLDFDVSPADGRLVYVSNNDLIVANPDGSGRSVLVDGPEMPPENDPQAAQYLVGKPRWSPDGSRIAYGLNGVLIVPASGGSPQRLIENDPLPALPQMPEGSTPPANPTPLPEAYAYWPEAWSPDGSQLLLGYALIPTAGGLALINPAGGKPQFIKSPEPFACCSPVWSQNSQSVFYASPYFGMFMAGLWRASAVDGSVQTLIQGDAQNGAYHMPGFVMVTAEGAMYFFYAKTDAFPEGQVKLTPVRSPAADPLAIQQLSSDAWMVGEALWAPDGSGVAIVDQEHPAGNEAEGIGQLLYLKWDNRPAVPLPISGYMLHWGR